MCGGTPWDSLEVHCATGLSPRVRGNHNVERRLCLGERSIPACAGEPGHQDTESLWTGVYPRVCGGTAKPTATSGDDDGLSPRVRGNLALRQRLAIQARSIPACAGEPYSRLYDRGVDRVYPRVCGGTCRWCIRRSGPTGLSPRVRGNRGASDVATTRPRSIPACAGEPYLPPTVFKCPAVYPRVCGGTLPTSYGVQMPCGLSPRVRGNRGADTRRSQKARSIPACAGEPPMCVDSDHVQSVYPRVCGGTCKCGCRVQIMRGLSPRVRGNPGVMRAIDTIARSIPACAGEPLNRDRLLNRDRVYPRVCGGTGPTCLPLYRDRGLSPRVRGNHPKSMFEGRGYGSIPACAGEPTTPLSPTPASPVYPRVCGGTQVPAADTNATSGLSPRVRGNPQDRGLRYSNEGSIPACAGEPRQRNTWELVEWVYPRVCGGTVRLVGGRSGNVGLSPRVRGNRPQGVQGPRGAGSIPACAGEPEAESPTHVIDGVYPRVCGGTSPLGPCGPAGTGLSPRVRGNPVLNGPSLTTTRSIPACAGEPRTKTAPSMIPSVYPRVCGGTSDVHTGQISPSGLSPRVRGNPHGMMPGRVWTWSIPACAGEPCGDATTWRPAAVYPRVCGGTMRSCRRR